MASNAFNSVADVLAGAIMMHPGTFAEACEHEANEDMRYVSARPDMPAAAKNGATARAAALRHAADTALECFQADTAADMIIKFNGGSWIAPFGVACRLLLIPPHVRTALAVQQTESAS